MSDNPFDDAAAALADPQPAKFTTSPGRPVFHRDLEQGSEEWHAARCGLLTASEMKLIVTPATMKACDNEKSRAHLWELLAQRISGYVEPHYIGDEMLRGYADEIEVCRLYSERFEPVDNSVGFITNDRWGFTLGYSPDGLVGEHGQLEAKSRRQKFHVQAVVENVAKQTVPVEFMVQVQTGLLVSERQWCDFIVFTGGLPMIPIRAYPDPVVHDAILNIAGGFETKLKQTLQLYMNAIAQAERLVPTERKVEEEMVI
jgi:predicted phage-related endonuclease